MSLCLTKLGAVMSNEFVPFRSRRSARFERLGDPA
jgi:hypothetical protein